MNEKNQSIAIGKRLRLAREQKGFSQQDVADKLGIHRPSLSEMEAGRRRMTVSESEMLAALLDVPLSWLTCADTDEHDDRRDRRDMVAIQLLKLTTDELDLVLGVLNVLRQQRENS